MAPSLGSDDGFPSDGRRISINIFSQPRFEEFK